MINVNKIQSYHNMAIVTTQIQVEFFKMSRQFPEEGMAALNSVKFIKFTEDLVGGSIAFINSKKISKLLILVKYCGP